MALPMWFSASILLAAHAGAADTISLRAWGEDTIRVQISPNGVKLSDTLPSAISEPPARGSVGKSDSQSVTNGNIKAEVGKDGLLVFTRLSDGVVLLRETVRSVPSSTTLNFSSCATKIYGMGMNRHGYDNKGLDVRSWGSFDFGNSLGMEGGPSNSLPWAIAGHPTEGFQFGFLWNSPAMGGAQYTEEIMQWTLAGDAGNQPLRQQFDFLVTTFAKGTAKAERPFGIIQNYVDAVGHARDMPDWALGYWHSKDRYASQKDLLDVAREYHNKSIPVDVIVIDWHHWDHLGDWSFNKEAWPDPKAMVDELKAMGTEVMVSVWPFTCPGSRSYGNCTKNNWITTKYNADGTKGTEGIGTHGKDCYLVDPTNPDFRKFAWSLLESGYYQYGIKVFWLDASEPEGSGGSFWQDAAWQAGSMRDMGSMFTLYWTQMVKEGLESRGEKDIIMLPRAGWVGTWKNGAVLWSGDIAPTMPTMADQIPTGLSAMMSGIPWWTTDIGGYTGGDAADPTYRDTIVRWFQYGVTNPLFRQHGHRRGKAGDVDAIWYYGPEDEKILGDTIKLRAGMKAYFKDQLAKLTATGRPFNRPLNWDFPDDPKAWELADGGIGNSGGPSQLPDGTYLELGACDASSWKQQWAMLSDGTVRLAAGPASKTCLDNGGSKGGGPPTGPYQVHMWSCAGQWASAQDWKKTGAAQGGGETLQATGSRGCLSAAATDAHPIMAPCSTSDPAMLWDVPSASGGLLKNRKTGKCVIAMQSSQNKVDQYMMGDDYMVAPITQNFQYSRMIYFPKGANWQHHFTGKTYTGGTTANVSVPLNQFALFKKVDAESMVV